MIDVHDLFQLRQPALDLFQLRPDFGVVLPVQPDVSPSLWAKVLVEEGEILPWEQPESTNPYSRGDKVTHDGKVWVSEIDGNIWQPGVYGWTEAVS